MIQDGHGKHRYCMCQQEEPPWLHKDGLYIWLASKKYACNEVTGGLFFFKSSLHDCFFFKVFSAGLGNEEEVNCRIAWHLQAGFELGTYCMEVSGT